MKTSYAFVFLAGGFLSSGYHAMPVPISGLFFVLGAAALLLGSWMSTEGN